MIPQLFQSFNDRAFMLWSKDVDQDAEYVGVIIVAKLCIRVIEPLVA